MASERYFGASIWEGCREHRMQTLEVSSKYALTVPNSAPRTGRWTQKLAKIKALKIIMRMKSSLHASEA